MVRSRSFNVLSDEKSSDGQEKRETSLMVPIVDLVNHESIKERSRWFLRKKFFFLKAAKTFEAGEEIVNRYTYKPKSIGVWMSNYGFIPNENDFPVFIFFQNKEDRNVTLPKYTPVQRSHVPARAMITACVMAANEEEFSEIRKMSRDVLKRWKKWVSKDHFKRCKIEIRKACRRQLKLLNEIKTTHLKTENAKNAMRARKIQKEILMTHLPSKKRRK